MSLKIWLAACCILWVTEGQRGDIIQPINAVAWWVFFGAWFWILVS